MPKTCTHSVPRLLFAWCLPLLALGVQLLLWPYVGPSVLFFFFFPAVFVSARVGGYLGGLGGTGLSAILVWYFFIPPRFSWAVQGSTGFVSVGIFLLVGYLVSDVHARLDRAREGLQEALDETREAKKQTELLLERSREIDVLKSRFFANVSHELRTPLTLVLAMLKESLAGLEEAGPLRRDLEVALRNARALDRRVGDILDIVRLDEKRMELRYSRCDLAELTRLTASQFETLARERKIRYTVEADLPVEAEFDVEKYQRIAVNLLSNAFKFTQAEGEIRVSLSAEGEEARLQVWDDGPGIPPAARERIFERFRQLELGDDRKHEGLGLGLAIVREFVELHRGKIEVSESPLGGAGFEVRLPRRAPPGMSVAAASPCEESPLAEVAVEELRPAGGEVGYSLSEGTRPLVLIAEDNADMSAFLRSVIGSSYRVATAYDGERALAMAEELRPDLLVVDLMMPVMDGEALVGELRSRLKDADFPVIILSAKADEESRLRLLAKGVQDYLAKPFEAEELLARIANLLKDRQKARRILRESENRYRLLAENIADVIWVLDLGTLRFRYVSPSVARLRGIDADEALEEELSTAFTPESARRLAELLPERFAEFLRGSSRSYTDRLEQPRRGGGGVWTETTTRFMRNPETERVEVYGVSRDIGERMAAEERIRKDMEEREILLRELSHRTKNNMNVIISMLSLRAGVTANEETSRLFREIESKIRTMALVHQKLYQSKDLAAIDLRDYLREIVALIATSNGELSERVAVELSAPPLRASIDIAIPCGLVLNELLANSFRHAFPDGRRGRIHISVEAAGDNSLEIRYADDGVGLAPDFDPGSLSTLGLKTTIMIVEHQLSGTFAMEDGKGFSCLIRFPYSSGPGSL